MKLQHGIQYLTSGIHRLFTTDLYMYHAEFCFLPADPGPCLAAIPRYYFNLKTGVCEEFTYGGCGGNENNFETLEECNQQCNPNGKIYLVILCIIIMLNL